MITVKAAETIIQSQFRYFGAENIPFEQALGRVLAENLYADRDMPPFNRVTMDGIAISYQAIASGLRSFHIAGTQAAGEPPIEITQPDQCVEIMTGAVLPHSLDTIVRYEDLSIRAGMATLKIENIKRSQNIHQQGKDKKREDVVAVSGQLITPDLISVAASVGKTHLLVKKMPRTVVISSGDELVEVHETPELYQIRRSNNYTIKAALQQIGVYADLMHIPDEPEETKRQIEYCLQHYDVIILSGGISMGKFDYIPKALEELSVKKLFHKVEQRPGKPFWFGTSVSGVLVFAFPGNPVATFMCFYRYFIPWLNAMLGLPAKPGAYAVLDDDFTFEPQLQYFLQVKLQFDADARLIATPVAGNGSGDFANLADTDAFMELPLERSEFKKGEVFRIWPFKSII